MKEQFSPNFDSRGGHAIDMLVLHYTGMQSAEAALKQLCNPHAQVSAHYLIEENGDTTLIVPEEARAWRAGAAYWRGASNINQRSVGIEIVNPGHEFGYRPFPAVQMKAVASLGRTIVNRHQIPPRNVVGHSDIAPARKLDPGELFDWQTLAKLYIGLWPKPMGNPIPADKLADYGYDTSDLPKAITAFQRHFRAKKLDGQWDSECASLLAGLLAVV